MTDEELIARLQIPKGWPTLGNAAADRIEALIAERDDALGEWDKAIVLADKAAALMNKMDTRRIAAEAKLAKAVEALELIVVDNTWGLEHQTYMKCRTTLAEIKGESHE